MPKTYTLENNTKSVLCLKHARTIRAKIAHTGDATDTPCIACTTALRMVYGSPAEFTATTDHGWTVTKHLDGTISCTCPSWRFRRGIPPTQRRCKHAVIIDRTPQPPRHEKEPCS